MPRSGAHPRRALTSPLLALIAVTAGTMAASAQSLPRAAANDQRTPAGRMADGELRVELEAVEAAWYPRGDDGPRVVTPAFAEAGGAPSVPGPLIRLAAGTPVRVTVTNRLARPIEVRGLAERVAGAPRPPGVPTSFPAFLFAEPLVIPSGESRVARFTPAAEVSSFYFGRVVPAPGAPPTVPPFIPGGTAEEGAFVGALVVDPAGAAPRRDERVFVVTRWGSPGEPGSLGPTWKMMLNGRSWPHTERIALTAGDTARWRVINTSMVDHPMHLHGFYFTVEGAGDTQADTLLSPDARREVVTEMMPELSSLRLRWVPERAGNWLFHCHLVRHSGEQQRFQAERAAATGGGAAAHAAHAQGAGGTDDAAMDMDGMAGMILGITVRARDGAREADPPPARRIHLWTGSRPGMYDGAPELGFVAQEGAAPPAPDSTVVPGSPLVLARGEPTEIVVHNRLDFPLGVHWHGLELRSLYDGVGHWSGEPGGVRPPIAPGDSQSVVIAPPRAGTFFYHTHGEPGYELAQGLYGAFLVLEPGVAWDRDADRLFVLGARGAALDAPPAVNGRALPPPERFAAGRTYRLRFAHISPDEFREVRLLRDGEPVRWRPLAKDGADLPDARRVEGPASIGLGVGEAFDAEWTPGTDGVYVLEVRTRYYPSRGGGAVQRVAFGVGDVTDEAMRRAVHGDIEPVALTAEQLAAHAGTFTGTLPPAAGGAEVILAVWAEEGRLHASVGQRGRGEAEVSYLAPLGEGLFAPANWTDGMVTDVREDMRVRFVAPDSVDVERAGTVTHLARRDPFKLDTAELRAFAGSYGGGELPVDVEVRVDGDALRLAVPGQPQWTLHPVSASRFTLRGERAPPGTFVVFTLEDGVATGLTVHPPGGPPMRVTRR